jgi:hypothetical protein
MRLILCNTHIRADDPPTLPDGHFLFACFEDFSVGPLRDWNDPPKFFQNRSDFWKTTPALDLPDGDKMDHFVWFQALPRHDLVELVKSGVPIDDIPLPKDFDDLLPQADRIEIWSDHTVSGCLFVWYLCALFEMTGIDRHRVSISHFSDSLTNERSPRFWSDMLMDTSTRSIPARSISKAVWRLMVQYWEVATRMPSAVDPALKKKADKHTLHAFKILMGRHSNPTNELTNIQERLIRVAPKKWTKMARVVGEAMGCGWDEKDRVGDGVLQFELKNMSRIVPPLFEISGTGAMRYCEVRLTKYGEKKQEQINC